MERCLANNTLPICAVLIVANFERPSSYNQLSLPVSICPSGRQLTRSSSNAERMKGDIKLIGRQLTFITTIITMYYNIRFLSTTTYPSTTNLDNLNWLLPRLTISVSLLNKSSPTSNSTTATSHLHVCQLYYNPVAMRRS